MQEQTQQTQAEMPEDMRVNFSATMAAKISHGLDMMLQNIVTMQIEGLLVEDEWREYIINILTAQRDLARIVEKTQPAEGAAAA